MNRRFSLFVMGVITVFVFAFGLIPKARAATEAEFEQFRIAMIQRQCKIESTLEILSIRQQLKWNEWKISEVMLWLAMRDEFACPGGCILIDERCPKK